MVLPADPSTDSGFRRWVFLINTVFFAVLVGATMLLLVFGNDVFLS